MKTFNLTGTQTAVNLLKSFAGESQARNRYTFYESAARQEGYIEIAEIFHETAENERAHAKRFFDLLIEGGYNEQAIDMEAAFPVALQSTQDNLGYAASGEHEEAYDLYPVFAQVAKEEGFPQIAAIFEAIASVERFHEERFMNHKTELENQKVFSKDTQTKWFCLNCGYIHEGLEAPGICPSCAHQQGYFKAL